MNIRFTNILKKIRRTQFNKTNLLLIVMCLLTSSVLGQKLPIKSDIMIRISNINRLTSLYDLFEKIVWDIEINSRGLKVNSKIDLNWKIISWDGTQVNGTDVITVKSNKGYSQIHWKPTKQGYFSIIIEASKNDTIKSSTQKSFVVGKSEKNFGKTFHYGVSTHSSSVNGKDLDVEIELLKKLGVDIVRDEPFNWNSVEPHENDWQFEKADKYIEKLNEAKIDLESLLCYNVKWASSDGQASNWSKLAPKLDLYLNYVRKVVDRYKNSVKYWEIWNEPDIGFWLSPTEKYSELFNATSQLINQIDSTAKVINGGFAFNKRMPNPDFLEKFISQADQKYWNIWAFHDYHTFSDFLARAKQNKQLYEIAGVNIPIWQNEGGFHTLNSGGEREQAITLAKKIITAPSLGLDAYFWYDLRDDGTDSTETEHHFGLVRRNYDPKPAYAVYQNLIRNLYNAQYVNSLNDSLIPKGVWGHVYRINHVEADSQNYTLVTWVEGSLNKESMLIKPSECSNIVGISDLMGNPISYKLINHKTQILVNIGSEPIYICIKGDAQKTTIQRIIETSPTLISSPSDSMKMRIMLNNPFPHSVSAVVDIKSSSAGIGWKVTPKKILIPALSSTELSAFSFLNDNILNQNHSNTINDAKVMVKYCGENYSCSSNIKIDNAIVIPYCKVSLTDSNIISLNRSYSFELNKQENVCNLFSAEPNFEMHWKNANDLSASAQLAYDEDYLHFYVNVIDDVHIQSSIGEDLWQGDGIQLVLRFDDFNTDFFEVGLARNTLNRVGGWVYRSNSKSLPLGVLDSKVIKLVERNDGHTQYRISIPWSKFGFDRMPSKAFRFNFIVNDNDGNCRKQYLELTPGIGKEKNPNLFKLFICKQ